jgi:hypothetical protein
MAKPLADCRVRVEFTRRGETYNIGLFETASPGRLLPKMGNKTEEATPSKLGQRLGKWIGEGVTS